MSHETLQTHQLFISMPCTSQGGRYLDQATVNAINFDLSIGSADANIWRLVNSVPDPGTAAVHRLILDEKWPS